MHRIASDKCDSLIISMTPDSTLSLLIMDFTVLTGSGEITTGITSFVSPEM